MFLLVYRPVKLFKTLFHKIEINVDTFLLEEFEQFFYKRASEPPDQSQNEVLISAEGCFLIHSLRL